MSDSRRKITEDLKKKKKIGNDIILYIAICNN